MDTNARRLTTSKGDVVPDVTQTGVAAMLAALTALVAKDGTTCPAAFMLAHLHRSRGAIELNVEELVGFLRTATHASPTFLQQTLVLSLPNAPIATEADLADDAKRALVRLAASAIVRAAMLSVSKAPGDSGARALLARDSLPSLQAVAGMHQDFAPISREFTESARAPQASDRTSHSRSVALAAAYQAARSRLTVAAMAASAVRDAQRIVDVIIEIDSETNAAALRSEAEDPLVGRSVLRRIVDDLEWLADSDVFPNIGTAGSAATLHIRLVLVDHTQSSVVVDVVRRFRTVRALSPNVSILCVVGGAHRGRSFSLESWFTEGWRAAGDSASAATVGVVPSGVAGAAAFLPAALSFDALQLGVLIESVFPWKPPAVQQKGSSATAGTVKADPIFGYLKVDGPLVSVPGLQSLAPYWYEEAGAHACFRSVVSSLFADVLAESTGHQSPNAVPMLALSVRHRVVVLGVERCRAHFGSAAAAVLNEHHTLLDQPLSGLLMHVLRRLLADRAPTNAFEAPPQSMAALVSAVPVVHIASPFPQSSAVQAASSLAAAIGTGDVEPLFAVSAPQSTPVAGSLAMSAAEVTQSGQSPTGPAPAAAVPIVPAHRLRLWSGVAALLAHSPELWLTAVREHPTLADSIVTPLIGARACNQFLTLAADELADPAVSQYIEPTTILRLPSWAPAAEARHKEAKDAAEATAAAEKATSGQSPPPSTLPGKSTRR
jgi:hypothetical protein